MKKSVYVVLLLIGIITFSFSMLFSGIVGSYIIVEENIEEHLIFTKTPVDKVKLPSVGISPYPPLMVS